jgi:hypothetical protein
MITIQHVTTLAAGAVPPVGAVACLLAVAVMLVLDRIPLSAYRPRQDDPRTPRRRRRPRASVEVEEIGDESPATTVRRLDRPRRPAISAPPARPRRQLDRRPPHA